MMHVPQQRRPQCLWSKPSASRRNRSVSSNLSTSVSLRPLSGLPKILFAAIASVQGMKARVCTALSANSLIFVAKMGAWAASGGSALLAEAIHSLADIGNQAMLRVGILKASEAPSAEFPYGHMRDKFIFRCAAAAVRMRKMDYDASFQNCMCVGWLCSTPSSECTRPFPWDWSLFSSATSLHTTW